MTGTGDARRCAPFGDVISQRRKWCGKGVTRTFPTRLFEVKQFGPGSGAGGDGSRGRGPGAGPASACECCALNDALPASFPAGVAPPSGSLGLAGAVFGGARFASVRLRPWHPYVPSLVATQAEKILERGFVW